MGYLNAYVRAMAVGGQVVRFLTDHLGNTIPHPASFTKIGNRFRQQVHAFAHTQGIPMLRLKKPDRRRWDDRKLDHVRPYLDEAESEGRFGVVAIVVRPQGHKPGPCFWQILGPIKAASNIFIRDHLGFVRCLK